MDFEVLAPLPKVGTFFAAARFRRQRAGRSTNRISGNRSPNPRTVGVLRFVLIGARKPAAGQRPGRGVNARLQPFGMNVIGEAFHVGEMLVRDDVALVIAQRADAQRIFAAFGAFIQQSSMFTY